MVFVVLGAGVDVTGGSVECDTGLLLEANKLMLQLEPSHILFNSAHMGGESAIFRSPILQREVEQFCGFTRSCSLSVWVMQTTPPCF